MLQIIEGIPDGTYTYSFTAQTGGSSTDGSYFNIVATDSEGTRILNDNVTAEARNPGWHQVVRDIEVTGGKVTVGIEAKRATTGGLWFYAWGFFLEEKAEVPAE
jgi:hypothetical protein